MVWWCGDVVVWCGGKVMWWCGGVVVWWCGDVCWVLLSITPTNHTSH